MTTTAPNTKTLRLLKAHTDNGKDYAAGDSIEVDESTAKWLIANEVVEVPADAKAAKATTAPTAG